MHATDVVYQLHDGAAYCGDCADERHASTDAEWWPRFADDEPEAATVCDGCGATLCSGCGTLNDSTRDLDDSNIADSVCWNCGDCLACGIDRYHFDDPSHGDHNERLGTVCPVGADLFRPRRPDDIVPTTPAIVVDWFGDSVTVPLINDIYDESDAPVWVWSSDGLGWDVAVRAPIGDAMEQAYGWAAEHDKLIPVDESDLGDGGEWPEETWWVNVHGLYWTPAHESWSLVAGTDRG